MCLNPCCSGIWSETSYNEHIRNKSETVLILVVVEYGLRHKDTYVTTIKCLNPCCSGIWSETKVTFPQLNPLVLILVVVEYGLRPGVLVICCAIAF